MRRHIIALTLLASTGCGSHDRPLETPVVVTAPTPTPRGTKPLVDPPYAIISDEDEGTARRRVEVNLKEKVTPEVLREIALEVKSKEGRQHERTAIFYYVPVEFPELAGQPWASTHFMPALEVKILGLSKEEEDTMRKIPLDHEGNRIGAWLPDDHYKTLDLIYEQEGVIKIAELRSATERSDSDMTEIPSETGRSFVKVKGSNIYGVDPAGNLRIFNAQGQVISAAKPMR